MKALRLQALGVVNGHSIYVPPAQTRRSAAVLLDPEVGQKLKDADVVLGVVGTGLSEACRQELNTSRTIAKPTIVMAEPVHADQLRPYFGSNLIVIDPAHPEQSEFGIVQHLKTIEARSASEESSDRVGTLALGLLIFAPQDSPALQDA